MEFSILSELYNMAVSSHHQILHMEMESHMIYHLFADLSTIMGCFQPCTWIQEQPIGNHTLKSSK